MEEFKSYIIQMYSPEDCMWIDCEEGRFNHTPTKLEIALDRIQMWAESIPEVDFRLLERTESIIMAFEEEDEDYDLE